MIIIKNDKGYFGKEVEFFQGIEKRILKGLLKEKTLAELSKELNISEQLLYYYLNKKLRNFIDKIIRNGKVYYRSYKAYAMVLEAKEDFITEKIHVKNLEPFIYNGILNSLIVVGAPFPHGPFSASARDIHYVGFLLAYFGKFFDKSKFSEYIRLDTDILKENLLNENLIIIGGPVTNVITYKLNTSLKVRFLQRYNLDIFSEFTNHRYSSEFTGVIAKITNPWNDNKEILLFAGKRAIGTKLAIKYFIQTKKIGKEFYIIIEGKDYDGDGFPEKIEKVEEHIVE